MKEHVTAWLTAYYDGELHEPRRQQVEEHLSSCLECQAELEQLQKLSTLLQEVPLAEGSLSASRFQAQVMLRLPPATHRSGWQQALKVGWQLAPLGAVFIWVIGQAVWLAASLVSAMGLPPDLERAGLLVGWLNLANFSPSGRLAETTIELAVLNLAFNALVAAFLVGWLASWWVVRHRSKTEIDPLAAQTHTPAKM